MDSPRPALIVSISTHNSLRSSQPIIWVYNPFVTLDNIKFKWGSRRQLYTWIFRILVIEDLNRYLPSVSWIIQLKLIRSLLIFHFYFQQPETEEDVSNESKQVVRKGIIWHQRDKLFSRWKERFFILTKDYFHCFKKDCSKLSEMGEFLFKVTWISLKWSNQQNQIF